jgi:hypothetical protein
MSSPLSKRRVPRFVACVMVVALVALVIALTLAVSGCSKASLVGKWNDPQDDVTIELKADGTVVSDQFPAGAPVTYKAEGGKLTITAAGQEVISAAPYTLDGDTLTLTDPASGEKGTLNRVK